MYFLVILTCFCLFWCIQFHWKKWRLYKLSWSIPGPINLPFIGSSYLCLQRDSSKIANRFMKLFEEYPEICKVWLGNELFYLVTKPEYLEIILNHPGALEKPDAYNYIKPVLGNGLLSGPVKTWRRHRKIIAPSLNQKILNEYPEAICQQCNILIDVLKEKCGINEIDPSRYLINCAIDIIGETIFDIPINAQITNANYSRIIDEAVEIVFLRMFCIFYQFDFIFNNTTHCKNFNESIGKIKKVTRALIEKKKDQLKGEIEIEDIKKKPFFDLVVEKYYNNEFSQEEVEDEVNTFLLAGSDTNATSSSFILTLLGMHQDIQQKVYDEVMEILGPDRTVTLDDLPKLKYLERVIKESLRVFPGGPFIGRVVEEDIKLDDIIIPKSSNIAIGYVHLHRSEMYWNEPLKFDPDRFLPERSLKRHPYTWLPFSGGPRNCIGMKYGMMVLKIMTAMVIRKFKVTSSIKSIQDIELTTNVVLKPKNGFRLSFDLR